MKLFAIRSACLSAALLLGGVVIPASAQEIVMGGGVNGGSVPRAMAPLCASARRLDGGGLSAAAALVAARIRLSAHVDYVTAASMSVAGCVPGSGVSVDSAFAPADNSVVTLSAAASLPIAGRFDLGLETGWVRNNSSWFIGPVVAGQYGRMRAELVGRLHTTSFEEITRDYDQSPVREISRTEQSERSWGLAARIMLLTGRGR